MVNDLDLLLSISRTAYCLAAVTVKQNCIKSQPFSKKYASWEYFLET